MIRSFRDRATETLWLTGSTRRFAVIAKQTTRKLDLLDAAASLMDLAAIPGNRLEMLRADRAGQHRIRINDQWRICLVWTADGPAEIEIVDYH